LKYVFNAWYVAGWSSEFTDKPVKVTILERDLVVYRGASGSVSALRDLCPHKLLPLSLGRIDGDNIQCGYHGTTFNPTGHCVLEAEQITAWRWIRDAPPVGFFKELGGFAGNVDRWHYYMLHMPSTAVIDFGSADSALNIPEEERENGMRIFAIHLLTPVNATHTIDRWMHLRNRAIDDDSVAERMNGLFRIAFDEDKEILEAIQLEENAIAANPDAADKPLRPAIDKAPNEYRRRIAELT